MRLTDCLEIGSIIPNLRTNKKNAVLEEIVQCVAVRKDEIDPQHLLAVILEREKIGSTAIGEGVAIPHGKLPEVKQVFAAFARSRAGVDFDSQDGTPTHLFFLLVAPEESTSEHLEALARVSRLVKDPSFRESLMQAETADEIMGIIKTKDLSL